MATIVKPPDVVIVFMVVAVFAIAYLVASIINPKQ
jgi:phage shock protein PspC (stress-responsive transcriptional regulator)